MTPKFVQASAVALLAGYVALGWTGIKAGLSSIDSYGIIEAANIRLQTGAFAMSRPPGHPLNEDWMLPAFAWMVERGPAFSSETYGFYQLAGGLGCAVFFWLLLGQIPLSPARRFLATACLMFSPFFLIESSDGEEFLWGSAFLFAALWIVAKLSTGTIPRIMAGWGLALACAVGASGCRIEFGVVALGMVFGTLLASDRNWRQKLGLILFAAVLLVLLWGPLVFRFGMNRPYPIPLSLAVRLGVGLYKIIFHALGLIPMVFAAYLFIQARGHFRLIPPFGRPIVGYMGVWLTLVFFGLFFLYPMKPAVMIPLVAFLILLSAMQAGPWLWACFVMACLGVQLAQLDCFDNRVWTGLKLEPSLWEQSLRGKPAFKGPEIAAASHFVMGGRRVVIANVWPWDLEWERKHNSWPGTPMPDLKTKEWPIASDLVW